MLLNVVYTLNRFMTDSFPRREKIFMPQEAPFALQVQRTFTVNSMHHLSRFTECTGCWELSTRQQIVSLPFTCLLPLPIFTQVL